MSRTRKAKRDPAPGADASRESGPTAANQSGSEHPSGIGPSGLPSDGVRSAISIWLPLHLFALFVSLTAVVEPSSLHARLQDLLRPYLQMTHFGVDDRPLYLAYGDASEQPHRLEVTESPIQQYDAAADWKNPHFRLSDESQLTIVSGPAADPGLAVSDRYARWLTTAATLAETEQPSLVAELLLPVVIDDASIRGVRIIRRPTDLNSTLASAETPYVARVVRTEAGTSLVQLRETRLNAIADGGEEAADE